MTGKLVRIQGLSLATIRQQIADYVERNDLDALREMRAQAKAIDVFVREKNVEIEAGLDSQRQLGAVITRLEVAVGEVLNKTPTKQGNAKSARVAESAKLSDLGVSHKQSARWKKAAKVPEEVREKYVALAISRGEAPSTATIAELGKLDHVAAAAAVERVARGEAKDIRTAIASTRHETKHAKLAELAQGSAPLQPGELGRFPVLLADPPWEYAGSTTTPSRRIENHYPTMALDEIRTMPVEDLATDDAVLFLWATSPLLPEALSVIPAWGFEYKTSIVWDKQAPGMGYWARIEHELLLIATRGNPPTPMPSDRPRSVVRAPLGKHSEKPAVFHELIERMFPSLPKLELFARAAREGWRVWGNQAA